MRVFVCTVDLDPCPAGSNASISFPEAIDPALFGVTPDTMLHVYTWGFGAVLSMWAIGYFVGLAVGMIRKV